MNNILIDFLENTIFPAVWDKLPQIMPEMQLRQRGRFYISHLKMYGHRPKIARPDKTCVTDRFNVLEHGEDAIRLTTYLQNRDNKSWIEVVRYLAAEANLTLPENESFNSEAYRLESRRMEILEVCNDYFIWNLQHNRNAEAEVCRNYLVNARKYTLEMAREMGVGYLPAWHTLEKYLCKKGFDAELIHSVVKPMFATDGRLGTSHRLTIPYISGGRIRGFKVRTSNPDIQPKYINTAGLSRNEGFFNMPVHCKEKEIIITEGEFDALHATQKGILNVVSLGGSSMHENQILDAVNRGVRRFTLCLDNDEAGIKGARKAIQLLRQSKIGEIYIARFPEAYKDFDAFLQENSAKAAAECIEYSQIYYLWQLHELLQRYEGLLTDRRVSDLLAELITLARSLDNDIERDILFSVFKGYGILPYDISREGFMNTL